MDFWDYLEQSFLLDEEYYEMDKMEEVDEYYETSLACPMYASCPYVDDCMVFEGHVGAVCWLMGGE